MFRPLSAPSRLTFLGLLMALIVFQTGCASTTPRQHWWEFWRPKTAKTQIDHGKELGYAVPDVNALPPDASSASGIGGDTGAQLSPLDASQYNQYMNDPEGEPLRQSASDAQQLATVHFGFDRYDLDDTARALLEGNVSWIARNPSVQIQIEGHTDERGTNEYNLLLGERRAKAVKAYLVSRGVPEAMLHTISYGEERPLDPGQNEAAWATNRRAQFLAY